MGREEVKLSLYADDIIFYTENSTESIDIKTTGSGKLIQQGSRIQDLYTEICCISLHQQWNIRNRKQKNNPMENHI